ncbi:DUF1990 domain-containing protein [Actinoplanes sp. NPDC051411]|uniref:DUF1990 domain-containing protein n=1 Tax=Actinoplanes sp. NPDC051411 TaxID=3155522 RepID=UPI00343EE3C1
MSELTYAPIGRTLTGDLPDGFRHLRYRTYLGNGDELFRRSTEAVMTFAMHRAIGAKVDATAGRAATGVRLTVGAGPLRVPCEVVWAIEEPARSGWGYGTLPGHQASGEEAFELVREETGRVWFQVIAYSRPARLPMKAAGPAAVLVQQAYARLLGRALKRLGTVNG